MTDRDPLSHLLSRWQPNPADSPDFAAEVHRRLARISSRSAPPVAPASWMARLLQFPATLPLAAGMAIVLGVGTGLSLNHAQTQDQMARAYARSIDPMQMSGLAQPPH